MLDINMSARYNQKKRNSDHDYKKIKFKMIHNESRQ